MQSNAMIEMRGITKHFGSVVANENVDLTVRRRDGSIALDDVSFSIRTGEILGVAGIAAAARRR